MKRLAACVSALVVMLAMFPHAAAGQSTPRIVMIRDAETENLPRAYADPLFRAAGVSPCAARITLIQDSAINAFVVTGNRMFIPTGPIQPAEGAMDPLRAAAQADLRNPVSRANMVLHHATRRQQGLPRR
ncbi:hypothetical protein ACQW02_21920 [Humitalea sp. 24SJ18S-53]|uniref:hypothetical protein n=1 Tax=Humitalea sp. 24SJ18S-53 TaxID=3422307 RepID=UPI003D66E63D